MIKAITKAIGKGFLQRFTVKYYSPEVDAAWTFDDECADVPSLQAVYKRDYIINGEKGEEDCCLYFAPEDAAAIGRLLLAWSRTHGER